MGSMLVGSQKFIDKANHFKKQCGGGIRQAGIMTSMALKAIDENFPRIVKSHDYAKQVGNFCIEHGIALESPVDTSFVFLDLKKNKMDDQYLIKLGKEKYDIKLMGGRIAFHFQLSQESVDNVKAAILECFLYNQEHPFVDSKKNNKKMYNYQSVQDRVQALHMGKN